jgi:hypothetical protein
MPYDKEWIEKGLNKLAEEERSLKGGEPFIAKIDVFRENLKKSIVVKKLIFSARTLAI